MKIVKKKFFLNFFLTFHNLRRLSLIGCLYWEIIGMLNINSNYGAAFAAKAAKSTNNALNTAFERLSSGFTH